MASLPKEIRFLAALAGLGLVFFLAPRAAPWLALAIVIGALAPSPGFLEDVRKVFLGG